MRVYRLQHPETEYGPWQHWNHSHMSDQLDTDDSREIMHEILSHCNAANFPTPQEDGADMEEYMACGCPDKETLFEWFPPHSWEWLKEWGFEVLTLEVSRVAHKSSRQVIYDPDDAIIIAVEDIPD